MVVFINLFGKRCRVLGFEDGRECSGREIKNRIVEIEGFPADSFFLTHNDHVLDCDSRVSLGQGTDCLLHCHARLLGGKGGFGSMLRAIGAQIEKTTNREACRDLSGRRMRDVNDEKKIADWLAKKSEREQEKARRKQERLEKLQTTPRHVFEESSTYTSQLQENMDSVDDALQKGLKSSTGNPSTSSLGKRKASGKATTKSHSKKQKLWLGVDEDVSSGSDDESDIRSSCSSVVESDGVVSEASSKMAHSVSGQTSEEELSDTQRNLSSSEMGKDHCLVKPKETKSSEMGKDHCLVKPKETVSATASTVSTPLASDPTDSMKRESKLENIKENEAEQGNDKTAASNVVIGSVAQWDTKLEESKPLSSIAQPLDLEQYKSREELEALGLDALKGALMAVGLKCGGTLQQRAERLFLTKGVPLEKLDPSLFAKHSMKKQGKKKGK